MMSGFNINIWDQFLANLFPYLQDYNLFITNQVDKFEVVSVDSLTTVIYMNPFEARH